MLVISIGYIDDIGCFQHFRRYACAYLRLIRRYAFHASRHATPMLDAAAGAAAEAPCFISPPPMLRRYATCLMLLPMPMPRYFRASSAAAFDAARRLFRASLFADKCHAAR